MPAQLANQGKVDDGGGLAPWQVQQLRVEAVDDVEVEDDIHFDAIRIQVASSDPGYGVTDIAQVVRIRDNDASESTMLVGKWGGQVTAAAPMA